MKSESAILFLILFIALGGCALTDDQTESSTLSQHPTVRQDLFELIQCSHCEHDFERVALPAGYDLPADDVAVCMAYVFDKGPTSRDLLVSALMECVEISSLESQ